MTNNVVADNERRNLTKILRYLFLFVFLLSVVGYSCLFIKQLAQRHGPTYWLSDFVETLSYCMVDSPYQGTRGIFSIYPPIAYLIFFPFYLICKKDLNNFVGESMNLQLVIEKFSKSISCMTAYLLFYAITMALIFLAAYKITKFKGVNLFYLLGIIFLSGPVFFAFQRGNIILFVFMLMLMFYWFYKSDKKWMREVSLIFFALAISIKIFPVILSLIFVKDKKWKDLFKTAIYTIILVFVPFAFVSGSLMGNVKSILSHYQTENYLDISKEFVASTCSFDGIIWTIYYNITGATRVVGTDLRIIRAAGWACKIIYAIFALSALFSKKNKNRMETIIIIISCYTMLQTLSGAYLYLFYIIPLLFLLNEYKSFSKKELIFYLVMFSIILCPINYIYRNTILQFSASLIMSVRAIFNQLAGRRLKGNEYVK